MRPQRETHYVPTSEEIAEAAAKIREGWDEATRRERAGAFAPQPVYPVGYWQALDEWESRER